LIATLIKKLLRAVPGKLKRSVRNLSREFDKKNQSLRPGMLEFRYHFNARFDYRPGCMPGKRSTPLIVSLTTLPSRLEKVYLCIEALLRQSCKPDQLLLWISDTVNRDAIPENLTRLTRRGLQIRFCRDIRAYTKIIHTLREFPDAVIVTADDDKLYPVNWLQQLYEAYLQDPNCILCHRAHLMTRDATGNLDSYNNWKFNAPGVTGPSMMLFHTGTGGVLYPPGLLPGETLNEKVFMDICLTNDDIWLKAMSLLNGVACKKVAPYTGKYHTIMGTQTKKLWDINKTENDPMIRRVFTRYGLYRKLVDKPEDNPLAELAENTRS
jgi:hypothetical protein